MPSLEGDSVDVGQDSMNEYEQQRADRVAGNRRVLMEMGLIDAVERIRKCEQASRATEKKGKAACRGQRTSQCQNMRPPARSSLRLKGQQPKGIASPEFLSRSASKQHKLCKRIFRLRKHCHVSLGCRG